MFPFPRKNIFKKGTRRKPAFNVIIGIQNRKQRTNQYEYKKTFIYISATGKKTKQKIALQNQHKAKQNHFSMT